jgi:hypothetical protein
MRSNGDGVSAPITWCSPIFLNSAQGLTVLLQCCSAWLLQVREQRICEVFMQVACEETVLLYKFHSEGLVWGV